MSDKAPIDIPLADDKAATNIEDATSVPLEPIDKPSTPQPEDALKTGKKRLREVSLEAPTLKDEDHQQPTDIKESHAPPKKNRLRSMESMVPEESQPLRTTPPPTYSPPLSTSPPHDTKVRQIRKRVKDLSWQEAKRKKSDSGSTGEADHQDEGPEAAVDDAVSDGKLEDDESSKSVSAKSDSDKDEVARVDTKGLPQGDLRSEHPTKAPLVSPPDVKDAHPTQSSEPDADTPIQTDEHKSAGPSTSRLSPDPDACQGKRRREDGDQNPREAKRITPPPEKEKDEPKAPSVKPTGFMAYASSASPFATTKNSTNIFGSSTATSTFGNSTIPKPPDPSSFPSGSSAFSSQPPHNQKPHVPTPSAVKFGSSGFDVYAAAASPFAKATASGVSPFGASTASSSKSPSRVERSKSPGRHVNAFGPYTTRSGKFGVSPARSAKKLKSASSLVGLDAGDVGTGSGSTSGSGDEAGEEEPGSPNFGDILSAKENKPDVPEAEKKVEYTEQEVMTGEEDERTEYQVRAKLFAMEPPPLSGWKERGVGTLKLNVNKKTGRDARLVLRTDGVLRLVLNTNLFKGMNFEIAQDPRYVKFGIVQDRKVVLHTLRLASVKHAEDLLEQVGAHTPGMFDSYDDEGEV